MPSEVSEIEARQDALGSTVTDLVRIVGKLDNKIDAGFKSQEARADGLESRIDKVEARIDKMEAELKYDISELKNDISELKSILLTVLSRFPSS